MNERLPYEEQINQQLNELPLPDANRAWADMKRRLEEDDDDGVVVWWRRGCMLWGLLLLVLLVTGWWFLKPHEWFHSKTIKEEIKTEKQNKNSSGKINEIPGPQTQQEPIPVQVNKDSTQGNEVVKRENSSRIKANETIKEQFEITVIRPSRKSASKKIDSRLIKDKEKEQQQPVKKQTGERQDTNLIQQVTVDKHQPIDNKTDVVITLKDSSLLSKIDSVITTPKNDSLSKTEQKKDSTIANASVKKDTSVKRPIFFSAGIAIHQQLPVAGQQLTPYNSLGRKGSIADYIPSVYFRINKKDRWFVQAEFRYGAPQYIKEFEYRQKIVPDTGQNPTLSTVTSSKLKKTYYHQLPLTFNYIVLPNWSVGAGIQWNKFYGLVSEKAVSIRDNLSQQDTVVSKVIIRESVDSATEFKKSYLLGVIETQYQWKRFSLGARYTFGLQPYIQFTLPGGSQQNERSQSIQVFLRYQLWRSKEK